MGPIVFIFKETVFKDSSVSSYQDGGALVRAYKLYRRSLIRNKHSLVLTWAHYGDYVLSNIIVFRK